jgi:hypothetical protein
LNLKGNQADFHWCHPKQAAVQGNTVTSTANFAKDLQMNQALVSDNKALVQNNATNIKSDSTLGDGKNVVQLSNNLGAVAQLNTGTIQSNFSGNNQVNGCVVTGNAAADQKSGCNFVLNELHFERCYGRQSSQRWIYQRQLVQQPSEQHCGPCQLQSQRQQNSAFISNNVAAKTGANDIMMSNISNNV